MRRGRVRRAFDALTGTVLVAFGIRLAADARLTRHRRAPRSTITVALAGVLEGFAWTSTCVERRACEGVDPDVLAAMRSSALQSLPGDLLERLSQGGRHRRVERGQIVEAEGSRPTPRLVIHGFVRVFRSAPDGRRIAARYARDGALLAISYQFSRLPVIEPG